MGLIISNLNTLGIVALCVLTFAWSLRTIRIGWQRQIVSGIAFGTGAIVSLLDPILLADGYRADARYLFISLISAFGGGFAALVATSMTILARITIGGQGSAIGVTCSVLAALLAWYWGTVTRSSNKRGVGSWIMLSLVAGFPIGVGFVISPPDTPYPAFVRGLFATISIFLFGKLMEGEKRRAVRESELDKAAGLDFLTQLPNRRALHAFLRSPDMRRETGRAFIAVDIDHFKSINDRYGHQTGDDVLKAIGDQLKSSIRETDFAARTGGEEFTVIIQAHSEDESREVAERIPTGQVYVATEAYGTPPHTWQMVTQGTSGYAHKGMLQAGKVLAASAVQCFMDPELILSAKTEHRQQLGGESYVPLIPAEATPQRLR